MKRLSKDFVAQREQAMQAIMAEIGVAPSVQERPDVRYLTAEILDAQIILDYWRPLIEADQLPPGLTIDVATNIFDRACGEKNLGIAALRAAGCLVPNPVFELDAEIGNTEFLDRTA